MLAQVHQEKCSHSKNKRANNELGVSVRAKAHSDSRNPPWKVLPQIPLKYASTSCCVLLPSCGRTTAYAPSAQVVQTSDFESVAFPTRPLTMEETKLCVVRF